MGSAKNKETLDNNDTDNSNNNNTQKNNTKLFVWLLLFFMGNNYLDKAQNTTKKIQIAINQATQNKRKTISQKKQSLSEIKP